MFHFNFIFVLTEEMFPKVREAILTVNAVLQYCSLSHFLPFSLFVVWTVILLFRALSEVDVTTLSDSMLFVLEGIFTHLGSIDSPGKCFNGITSDESETDESET